MPFEYEGQTYPDTNVVSEQFQVDFRDDGRVVDPEFPLISYQLCYESFRVNVDELSCSNVTDIQDIGGGLLRGRFGTFREGETMTNAHMHVTLRREQSADIWASVNMTPEEQAILLETRVSPASNEVPMPQARMWSVPEPGLLVMLAMGVLALAVAGWRRKIR